MTTLIVIAIWYVIGLVGSFIAMATWWRQKVDVHFSDLWLALFLAIMGPINLLIGLFFMLVWALSHLPFIPDGDTVIWRGRE